jgi:hypothetical protein
MKHATGNAFRCLQNFSARDMRHASNLRYRGVKKSELGNAKSVSAATYRKTSAIKL